MNKTKKILITIALSLLIGLGVYFIYVETIRASNYYTYIETYGFTFVSIFPKKALSTGIDGMVSWPFIYSILLIMFCSLILILLITLIIKIFKKK